MGDNVSKISVLMVTANKQKKKKEKSVLYGWEPVKDESTRPVKKQCTKGENQSKVMDDNLLKLLGDNQSIVSVLGVTNPPPLTKTYRQPLLV